MSISSTFYVQIFRTNVISASFSSYVSALAPKFCTKNVRVNVDEIDTRALPVADMAAKVRMPWALIVSSFRALRRQ